MLIVGCGSDPIEDSIEESELRTEPGVKKNDSTGNGEKPITIDSAARYALIQYNNIRINELGGEIVEKLLKKNRVLEFSNALGDVYGYAFTKEIKDSLTYFGFQPGDISYTDPKKDIYLSGRRSYVENGTWEKTEINNKNIETKYPNLYKKALERFFLTAKPKIIEINVADRAGNTIDYCEKVSFSDGQEQYICFSIQTSSLKTIVTLIKS